MKDLRQLLAGNASVVAPHLLGCRVLHRSSQGICGGVIVEVEAYQSDDPASHTHKGLSPRNRVMFGPAGHAYVYFTYGMHYCLNVVTGTAGDGQGVLIRALEPVEGIKLMQQRRKISDLRQLTNGPAKLTQALGINTQQNGASILTDNDLVLLSGSPPTAIVQTTRIGISKAIDHPWRFYIKGNPYVSKT